MSDRGYDEVELVDEAPPVAAERGGPARSRRRGWWLAAAAVLVVVLLVQGALDLRERRRLERLREVPGVVGAIGTTIDDRWLLPEVAAPLDLFVDSPVTGTDLVLVVVTADDGSVAVQGRAPGDGAVRWSTDLLAADEQRAEDGMMPTSSLDCTGMGDEALLGCIALDQDVEVEGDAVVYHGTRSATLLLLDVRDGRVVGRTPLPDPSSAAADVTTVAGLLVTPCGTDTLCAWRPGQDEPRWRLELDASGGSGSAILPLPGAVAWVRGEQVDVVGPDGAVQRSVATTSEVVDDVMPMCVEAAGAVVCSRLDGSGSVVLGSDVELRVDGTAIQPVADDGSVPGLLLTDAGGVLTAWDASTGEVLWRGASQRGVVVLGGRVYVLGAFQVSALDGRSGQVIWERSVSTSADTLVTDGLVLAPLQTWTDDTTAAPVEVLRLSDGTVARTLTRADDDSAIGGWVGGHHLYGYGKSGFSVRL